MAFGRSKLVSYKTDRDKELRTNREVSEYIVYDLTDISTPSQTDGFGEK